MAHHISDSRLVKVLLPSGLVHAMDEVIAAGRGYTNRNEFISDAVHGHLAELMALQPETFDDAPRSLLNQIIRSGAPMGGAVESDLMTSITAAPHGVPTLRPVDGGRRGPTWGMHNRDFPTLWALSHLAGATHRAGGPVPLKQWTADVVHLAWRMAGELPSDRYDTSGFPGNPAKREAAEGRFVRFFLGTEEIEGPLFDLALVGCLDDLVAPTDHGVALLEALEGFGCEREQVVMREWTEAYLQHLSRHARADAEFLRELLRLIANGVATRTQLIETVQVAHPDWSESVVETNVAGFIARGREWGLIRQKQHRGSYVIEEGALELTTAVVAGN